MTFGRARHGHVIYNSAQTSWTRYSWQFPLIIFISERIMVSSMLAIMGVVAVLGQVSRAAPPSPSSWYSSMPSSTGIYPSPTAATTSNVANSSSTVSNATWYNGHTAPLDCSAQFDGKLPGQIPTGFHYSGNVRSYYIQAEMVDWNFVPSGM